MRQLITLCCLIAAGLFFAVGSVTGMAIGFGAAAMFEMGCRIQAKQQARARVQAPRRK